MTLLPVSLRCSIDDNSLSISLGCRPIEGSSSTYSTPVKPVPICEANLILCDSPPDRVFALLEREMYFSPTLTKKFNLLLISFIIGVAIPFLLLSNFKFSRVILSSSIGKLVISIMLEVPILTAREEGFNLIPSHWSHTLSVIYFSISIFLKSEFVSLYNRFNSGITPSY